MPIDAGKRRRTLHRIAATDGVVNLLELDKTDELSAFMSLYMQETDLTCAQLRDWPVRKDFAKTSGCPQRQIFGPEGAREDVHGTAGHNQKWRKTRALSVPRINFVADSNEEVYNMVQGAVAASDCEHVHPRAEEKGDQCIDQIPRVPRLP